ncbi:hypothetical protein [Oryzicola mucosus]|uniref:Uncharacterized protein n=1 Tax=Oryzicola mucosus TaxID=2767425 RepID=A0A8J6PJK2_9HYPH|nr:hypothetical protein [Oryzicola mucosus]MBD0416134.1 hypothetical protein [Oryzicola mucosus]
MNIHNPEGMQVPDFIPTFDSEGGFIFITIKESHRLALETTIERLINMLDDMDPDPDLEPYLAGSYGDDREEVCEDEGAQDDREEVNEDGGDIQDEGHDEEPDREPFLGWDEQCSQGRGNDDPNVQILEGRADSAEDDNSALIFTGEGYKAYKKELVRIKLTKRDMLGDPRAERLHIMPDGKQFRTIVYADLIPELDHRAHYLAAHGLMPGGRAGR